MQSMKHISIQCSTCSYVSINKGLYYISDQIVEDSFNMHDTVKSLVAQAKCVCDVEYFSNDVRGTGEILFDSDRCKKQIEERTGYIYTLTILKSDRQRKVVLSYANWGFYSIWMNDVLLTSLPYSSNDADATILYLEPGDNYLVTRLDIRRSTIGISLRMNVYDYDYAVSGENEYIKYLVRDRVRKQVKLIFDYNNDMVSHFMLVKTDLTSTKSQLYNYQLTRVYGNEHYCQNKIVPYNPTLFPTAERTKCLSQLYDFEILSDGFPIYRNLLLLSSINVELAYLEQQISTFESPFSIHNYVRDIEEKINTIKTSFPLYINYCFYSANLYLYELRSVYHLLQYGKDAAYYQRPSLHHFCSGLDGQDEQIGIHIPYGLNPLDTTTKYSLCILATTGPDHLVIFDRFPELSYHYADVPVIFASISGKGVTTGSYIGEAAFMDCLHELLRLFPIDTDRISLHGTSNGAYTTWAIAESYPHLFSAISPISGFPVKNQLQNLSNIYIHNVHENPEHGLDLFASYDYPNYMFQKNGTKYSAVQYEHESHMDLYKLLFHPSIVEKLLPHTRIVYPKHIRYLTSNGLHNQAYYIAIEGVVQSAIDASFDSVIILHEDGATWSITTNNITKLSLKVPPYLNQVSTRLIIDSVLVKHGYLDGTVHVDCTNQCLFHEDTCRSLRLWNSGIVSCYQGNVKILLPNTLDSRDSTKVLRVAMNLSSPKTSGYIQETRVKYPIITENQVTLELLRSSNWLIIGKDYTNEYVKQILQSVPISLSSNRFTYYGSNFDGPYSLICALPNIYNPNTCVTIIAYSSPNYLRNNFFLRNMILSSVANGFHPYLNQALLVKVENEYLCAKVMGDDLISVNQFIQNLSHKKSPATVSWDMSDYGVAISLIATNIVNKRIENGLLKADGWRGDPNLTLCNTEIDAEQYKFLSIEYMNKSSGRIAQLFFSQTTRYDFCEEQSILFEITPNDTIMRKYVLDLSQINTWKGIIRAVRFDPFSYDIDDGHFELLKISFEKEQPLCDVCRFISSKEAEIIYKKGYKKCNKF